MSTPTVIQSAAALYGIVPSASFVASINDEIATVFGGSEEALLNHYFELVFVVNNGNTSQEVASRMVANMGLTGDEATTETARIAGLLEAAPVNERGALVKTVVTEFEASGSVAATSFVSKKDALVAAVDNSSYQGIAGQEVIFSNLSVLQIQNATTGSIFSLTTATDDEIQGGATDDLILATTTTIAATDEVDGGAGNDRMNIVATGAMAAASIDNVEEINVEVRYFDTTTALNFTNVDVVETGRVFISRPETGYSNAVTITAGGDNNYTFGPGITTATFSALGDGLVTTGSLLSLTTTAADSEVNLKVQGTTVNFIGDGGITDMNIEFDGGGTLDIQSTENITGDIIITGAGTVRGAGGVLDAAEITGPQATLRLDAAPPAVMDLEDVNVATLRIEGTAGGAYDFKNANDTVFDIREAGVTFSADVEDPDDGGTYTVNINVDGLTSLITAGATGDTAGAINHDFVTVNVNATAVVDSIVSAEVGGETRFNINGSRFTFDTLTEANTSSIAKFFGSQSLTFTSLDVTELDASAYTGNITITDNAQATASNVTLGSGNDVVAKVDEDISQTYNLGPGNDTIDIDVWAGATGQGLAIFLGAGDDRVDFDVDATDAGSLVISGGAGNDIFDVDIAGVNFEQIGFAMSGIETVSLIAGTHIFPASSLSGLTETTIAGTAAAGEVVTIRTNTNESSIDLSGVTFANIDTLNIDLLAIRDAAFTATLTDQDDTVTAPAMGTRGFNIDLGAGDDQITLSTEREIATLTITGAGTSNVSFALAIGNGLSSTNTAVTITIAANGDDSIDGIADAIVADYGATANTAYTVVNKGNGVIAFIADDTNAGANLTNLTFTTAGGVTASNSNAPVIVNNGGAVGSGGTLTLGEGSDTVIVPDGSSMILGDQLVSITDFDAVNDVLNMPGTAAVAARVLPGVAVDVSAATSLGTDSFSAIVTNGKITLLGNDAANVDTLAEWITVAAIIGDADGNAQVNVAFEFGGDLYVFTADGTTATAAGMDAAVRLIGMGDFGIGAGGGAGIVTIS